MEAACRGPTLLLGIRDHVKTTYASTTSDSPPKEEFRPLPLRINFSWTFLGNIVYAVCQWGLLVALAKLGTPSVVGLFVLSVALTRPIYMFSYLQLQVILITDAKGEYCFGHYLGLRLITTVLALAAVGVVVAVSGHGLYLSLIILIQGLAGAFAAVAELYQGQFLRHERMDRDAVSVLIRSPLNLLALAAGYYMTGELLAGVAGMALVEAGVLFLYDMPMGNRVARAAFARKKEQGPANGPQGLDLKPAWDKSVLGRLAWLALPLGLVMMLNNLLTQIPRYFVSYYMGEHTLGIFAALSQFMIAGSLVIIALGEATMPRLSAYYAEEDFRRFKILLAKLTGVGFLFGAAGLGVILAAGKLILTTFYGPEYAEHTHELNWMMVVSLVLYFTGILGFGMSAARYFRIQLPIMAGVIILFCLGCLVLIPRFGILGAVWAQGAAMVCFLAGELAVLAHALKRPGDK